MLCACSGRKGTGVSDAGRRRVGRGWMRDRERDSVAGGLRLAAAHLEEAEAVVEARHGDDSRD